MSKLGIKINPATQAPTLTRGQMTPGTVFHYAKRPDIIRLAVAVDQDEVEEAYRGRPASINLATGRLGWAKRGSSTPVQPVAEATLNVTPRVNA